MNIQAELEWIEKNNVYTAIRCGIEFSIRPHLRNSLYVATIFDDKNKKEVARASGLKSINNAQKICQQYANKYIKVEQS